MSALELSSSGARRPTRAAAQQAAARTSPAPILLGLALLVLTVYAVFAQGAIQAPAEPRLQIALALVAAGAATAWLWTGSLRLAAPPVALAGLVLIAGFAVWSGVSLAWSVAPDLTWLEFNRMVAYAVVLGLAVMLGASTRRATMLTSHGLLWVGLLAALYALGQKVLPAVHVAGLFNLNQTGKIARLQEPIGYWNALAAFFAIAAPVALAAAVRLGAGRRMRLASLVALELMFVAIGFTYSRGGLIALVVGIAVFVALSRSPLRVLMWLAGAVVAAAPAVVLGLTSHALTANGVALDRRESAGVLLLVVLVASAVLLWLGADRLLIAERTIGVAAGVRRLVGRGLVAAGAACVVAVLVAVALSTRGFTGTFTHLWSSFTATNGVSVSNPNRLLSADSANRWVWWKEALGAFSSRPVAGWGAGSFPIVHLLFRHDTLTVEHAHSAPLQWLAETGLVGLVLVAGGWLALLRTGFRAVRSRRGHPEGVLVAGLVAAVVAYTLHALYDWDWDVPGLTLPVLIVLGVLAGSLRTAGRLRRLDRVPLADVRLGSRLVALVSTSFALCLFALSVVMPNLAASRASAALVAASGSSRAALLAAQHDAAAADTLDPVSDAGLKAQAAVAEHRADLRLARVYLLEAVVRQPSDVRAWWSLAYLDVELGHREAGITAAQHVLELDPYDAGLVDGAAQTARQALLDEAPPRSSATAIATPASGSGSIVAGSIGAGSTVAP